MTGGQIEANKVVFKKVFSEEFWFVIPEYQRSYVWQEENVSELVEDLLYAFAEKPHSDYFLGSLVLKRTTDSSYPEYEVLDGQQRLTTFFMMMAVLRDIVSHPNTRDTIQRKIYQEENRLENIPARMRITYKIRDKVEDFIKEFIVQQDGTTKEEQLKSYLDRDNVSLSNMAKAINLLRATFLHQQSELDLEEFIRFIFNKAMFIYVSTDNMEDAFRLFTILNDRGIPLTNADILKSQNIGALESEKDVQKYAKIWEEIEGNIYKKQYCRYLLLKLEYLLSDNTVHLSNYNYITVEHILPQNPAKNSQWRKDFTDEEREYWVDKLANLVLINKRKNSALSNLNFAEKKKRYLKGRIDVFQGSKVFIDSKQTITPDILKTRQQELITLLTGN